MLGQRKEKMGRVEKRVAAYGGEETGQCGGAGEGEEKTRPRDREEEGWAVRPDEKGKGFFSSIFKSFSISFPNSNPVRSSYF